MAKEFTFRLGSKVKDKVTGFVGIVVSRIQHISGCDSYWVQPPMDPSMPLKQGESSIPKPEHFDEPRLTLLEEPTEELNSIPVRAREVAGPGPG